MKIRRAREADVEAVTALVNEAYLVEAPFVEGPRIGEDEVRTRLGQGEFLLAEEGAALRGCVFVSPGGEAGDFGLLAVRPGVQGRGLGRRLTALAEARLAEAGRATALILVASERAELLPFYAEQGYLPAGTRPFGATARLKKPCHFLVMRKTLAEDEVRFRRRAGEFVLDARLLLKRSIEDVFPFFADAGNLDALTPPWLHFRILTPLPLEMRRGALINYRLRLHGVPLRWRSEITTYDPPHRFVDEQRHGPYRLWHHEHAFTATDLGTLIEDRVRYRVPGGGLAHALLVRRDLERIFRFRQQQVRVKLGG
jgi:ligand-binding SRPBCC domain-containing protein/N-acetylglutamate synthase-like GNAT family acetyltransferase